MVNGVGTSLNFSNAQALRTLNAFKMDEKVVKKAKLQLEEPTQQEESLSAASNVKLRDEVSFQKANEIKEYGKIFDMNISNSDINYALSYGRSVIVDYSA